MKRIGASVLALCLLLGMAVVPTVAAASNGYRDTAGHWAKSSIETWSDYGILQGTDGAFHPDAQMTRGEMAAVLARLLGLTKTVGTAFADVPADAWYADAMLKCVAAGILQGDGGNAKPNATMTRAETAVMLCRGLDIAPAETAPHFADAAEIGDWASGYIAALHARGIIQGVGENRFAPTAEITRAAVVKMIDNAVVQYINKSGTASLTAQKGIILVAAKDVTLTGTTENNILVTPAASSGTLVFEKATVTGKVTVQADNAKLTMKDSNVTTPLVMGIGTTVHTVKSVTPTSTTGGSGGGGGGGGGYVPPVTDLTISKANTITSGTYRNVTIAASVADGTVTLKNVTIQGNLTVLGGGLNTIALDGCTITGAVVMNKDTTNGGEIPRVLVTNTPIVSLRVEKSAIVEAADSNSPITALTAYAPIEFKGTNTTVGTLTVPAGTPGSVVITVTAGTVALVNAEGATEIAGNVAAITAEAAVAVKSGTVGKIDVPDSVTAAVAIIVDGGAAVGEVAVASNKGVTVDAVGTVSNISAANPAIVNTIKDKAGVAVTTHIWGKVIITPATCAAEGANTYPCIVEGCTHTKIETLPKLPHTPDGVTECDKASVCTVCGAELRTAGTHTWGEFVVTKPATDTEKGSKTATCAVCLATKTEEIPALKPSDPEIDVSTPSDGAHFFLVLRENENGYCEVKKESLKEHFPELKHFEFGGMANLGNNLDPYLSDTYHMSLLVGSGGTVGSSDQYGTFYARKNPPSPRRLLLFSDLTTLCGYAVGVPQKVEEGVWQLEVTSCAYDFSGLYEKQAAAFKAAAIPQYIEPKEFKNCGTKWFLDAFNASSDNEEDKNAQLYYLWNQSASPCLEHYLSDISTLGERLPKGDKNRYKYYYLFNENKELIGYTKLCSGDDLSGLRVSP